MYKYYLGMCKKNIIIIIHPLKVTYLLYIYKYIGKSYVSNAGSTLAQKGVLCIRYVRNSQYAWYLPSTYLTKYAISIQHGHYWTVYPVQKKYGNVI